MSRDVTTQDLARAADLVMAVSEHDADAVAAVLQPMAQDELYALAVLLAANVSTATPLRIETDRQTSVCGEAIRRSARLYRVPPSAILGRQQTLEVLYARQVAMRAARLCGLSFPQIGKAFHRDHSTVMNACTRAGELTALRDASTRVAWAILGEQPPTEMDDRRKYDGADELAAAG